MVLDCSCALRNPIAEMIAYKMGDEYHSLYASGATSAGEEIFSANAYIFVTDIQKPSPEIMKRIASTTFTGSKALYCLYVSRCLYTGMDAEAKKVTDKKGLVLFGCESIVTDADGSLCECEMRRLETMIRRMRDYRPLSSGNGIGLPYRGGAC